MLGICQRYCSSNDEAEDVMLTGFMNIFTKIKSFKGSGSFEGWMKITMVNTAIDNFRKQKKHRDIFSIADYQEELTSDIRVPQNIEKEDIMNMLRNLPPGYKIVFNLYAIEGYNHQEIAEMLGISVNTSKTQLFKARKILKELIIKWNNGVIVTVKNE